MNKYFTIPILFALAAILLAGPIANAQTAPFYSSQVSYPSDVGTGQQFNITITSSAGFSNYNFTIYIAGTNLTGLSPTNTIHQYYASKYNYTATITAPETPQTLYLYIVTSAYFDGVQYNYSEMITVSVISPIYFHVFLSNPTSYPVYDVTATFYVDGTPVLQKTVPKIMPGSTVEVNATYINPNLGHGSHTLTVTINNANIKIDGNANSISTKFYYGTPPNYNWIYYVFAVVLVFMVIMVLGSNRGRNQPKWKKAKK
ncbi:hypothetical protein [Thermoplasma acidophilum]|uniref:CARDB domain-containing protein n=1 Tax=Thermoplasma acidophilum (strain ATCC 25905 / DSM 1728 / JCM 9062 / NBRC 15155 / AMRC-C165) TaxID=273075 RepID=Q9HJ38_THEAC|nr:CARDB domain-containing protein [Thermoplasma acidophilum]MCY0851866.1 hypothetical protein [Thermoplasma acidophilum]CAC12261.1 hypothetical protein [Thermoplasma acidophilum]